MSTILRNAAFQKYIARVNVDEAHSIYTAGQDLHGLKAFRPAWGQVADLRALLNESIHWNFFSATSPLHILKMIELKVLRDDYIRIQITSNHPNTMCATHKIVNSIEDPRNYECFLSKPFLLEEQPHVLIFCDDKDRCLKVSCHLNSCLPPVHQIGATKALSCIITAACPRSTSRKHMTPSYRKLGIVGFLLPHPVNQL